jgi:DNA (cytosine-5)-methyltransferase 1
VSAHQKLPQFIHSQPSIGLLFEKELVVDLFSGGGGASAGIARAYREPDVAANHNSIALAVHRANHPKTAHYVADMYEVYSESNWRSANGDNLGITGLPPPQQGQGWCSA